MLKQNFVKVFEHFLMMVVVAALIIGAFVLVASYILHMPHPMR